MPCRQVSTFNGVAASSGSYATEADCNQACREGACCEGTTCTVKPQCQCQGAGKTFLGVGTTCEGNPCGCCCVNGNLTQNNEQQCAAAGGTWRDYLCNSPSPASMLLVLSLNDYGNIDFSCVRGTHTLARGGYISGVGAGYQRTSNAFSVGFQVTTICSCALPKIRLGAIHCNPLTVLKNPEGDPVQCAPQAGYNIFNFVPFYLLPEGGSGASDGYEIAVPGFCTGQFSVSGVVRSAGALLGEGGVTVGTFTLGNPLP